MSGTTMMSLYGLPQLSADDAMEMRLVYRGVELATVHLAPGIQDVVGVQAVVIGRDVDSNQMLHHVELRLWQSVEEIAKYIEGDGTDAQRMALADGIRQGPKRPASTPP